MPKNAICYSPNRIDRHKLQGINLIHVIPINSLYLWRDRLAPGTSRKRRPTRPTGITRTVGRRWREGHLPEILCHRRRSLLRGRHSASLGRYWAMAITGMRMSHSQINQSTEMKQTTIFCCLPTITNEWMPTLQMQNETNKKPTPFFV